VVEELASTTAGGGGRFDGGGCPGSVVVGGGNRTVGVGAGTEARAGAGFGGCDEECFFGAEKGAPSVFELAGAVEDLDSTTRLVAEDDDFSFLLSAASTSNPKAAGVYLAEKIPESEK
jgi:hypothetical protein